MPGWLVVFIGWTVLVMEGLVLGAVGADGFAVQLILAVTVYLGLRRDFVVGAWALLALLLPTEWMASGPVGLYSLGMVMLFLTLRLIRSTVQSRAWIAESTVGAVAGLYHGLVMVGALLITTPDSPIIPSILWQLPMVALTLGIATPIALRAAGRADERLRPSGGLRINA